MKKINLLALGLLSLYFAYITQSIGQSNADSSTEDDVFVLSPFVIESSDNDGYLATSTLSGTRIKSNLNEVGSSISIMTKELLDDIGATDISDAFMYSVNTENEDEYASDDSEGISISTTNSNRVRGLASSTYARGFFDTNVRGDSYNMERFTISNGPNSILYGLGSPAGIVNFSTKKAHAHRQSGEMSFRFDSENGSRFSADWNQPLIKDKLAARIAVLDQTKKSWKQPDNDDEQRIYTTFTYKPFESTTIRYSYEHMENERIKGRSTMPVQAVRTWMDNGRPLYDHINEQLTYDNGSSWVDVPRLANGNLDEDALFALGIEAGAGVNRRIQMYGANDNVDFSAIADADTRAVYEQYGIQAMRWRGTAISTGQSEDRPFTVTEKDDSLLPLDYSISGSANFANFESDTHTLVWEQRITDDLHVEVAYNEESWSRDSYDPIRGGTVLYSDVNYYLPVFTLPGAVDGSIVEPNQNNSVIAPDVNGSPALVKNPNAGRYYVQGRGIGFTQDLDFKSFRATASYSLDLTEYNKWFGQHSVALLYQKDEKEEHYVKTRHFNSPDHYLRDVHNAGSNDIEHRYYVDPPTIGTNGETAPAHPQGFELVSSPWESIRGAAGTGEPGSFIHSMRELEGKMIVVQNRLLNNRLITTFGFRSDEETLFQSYHSDDADTPIHDFNYTDAWIPLPDSPTSKPISGDTKTMGAVYVINDWLRVFYNKSDSFQPQGNLHDYWNNPLPPADGEGEDIGVMLNLMDGKLNVRAAMYEQSANGALELNWEYERLKWRLVNRVEQTIERWSEILPLRPEWAAERNLSVEDVHRPDINDNLRSIRDFESEGFEVELNARPIKGLDLRLTFAKSEAMNTRSLPNLQAYVAERLPIWKKYELLADNPTAASRIPDPADPSQDAVFGTTRGEIIANNRSMGYDLYISGDGLSRMSFAVEEEGSASARNRKYRANFIANYQFSDGRLKGFSTGVGVRWRSKAAIGYMGKPNPMMIALLEEEPDLASRVDPLSFLTADVTKPIWGDELMDVDAWFKYVRDVSIFGFDTKWRVQLNIRNLLNDDDVIARKAIEDGRVTQWQAKAPRSFILTNTFSF